MRAPISLPETTDLARQLTELHDREAELLLTLGRARLFDEPTDRHREALRELREEMETLAAASRVLEAVR